jgi:hypothetical protein
VFGTLANISDYLVSFTYACTGLFKISARLLEEKEVEAYRKIEKEEMNTLLNQYVNFCRVSLKVS